MAKRIGQYSMKLEFIKEFSSLSSAAREMNVSRQAIFIALNWNHSTSNWFYWKYID